MFLSDVDFELKITTATESLVMTTDLFILSASSGFVEDITAVTIKATSTTTKQTISIRLFGV